MPGATVRATNTATAASRTTPTTSVGLYTIPELPAGTYKISVEKAGFREAVINTVTVVVNTTTRIDVTLALGTTTQTVEVAAAPALLQTDRTDVGSTLTTHEILDLPLSLTGGLRDTKSGTNQFHGGLFEYLRNTALNARGLLQYHYAGHTPERFRRDGRWTRVPAQDL